MFSVFHRYYPHIYVCIHSAIYNNLYSISTWLLNPAVYISCTLCQLHMPWFMILFRTNNFLYFTYSIECIDKNIKSQIPIFLLRWIYYFHSRFHLISFQKQYFFLIEFQSLIILNSTIDPLNFIQLFILD